MQEGKSGRWAGGGGKKRVESGKSSNNVGLTGNRMGDGQYRDCLAPRSRTPRMYDTWIPSGNQKTGIENKGGPSLTPSQPILILDSGFFR